MCLINFPGLPGKVQTKSCLCESQARRRLSVRETRWHESQREKGRLRLRVSATHKGSVLRAVAKWREKARYVLEKEQTEADTPPALSRSLRKAETSSEKYARCLRRYESGSPALRADPQSLRASNTARHFRELLIPPWSARGGGIAYSDPPPLCKTQRAVTWYQPSPGPEKQEQPDSGKNLTCYVFWVSPGRNLYTVKDGGAENYMLWESWFTRLRLGERLCHLGHENSSYQMIAWSLWSVCGSIPAFVPFTATEPSRVISTGRSWECYVSTKTQLGLLVVLWLDVNL